MRYAAVVAASMAAVATFAFARDGRSEPAPAVAAAAAQTVPARLAQQQPAARRAGAQQEDFRWSGRLARGQEIEVRGIVGDVTAQPASGDQVEVVGRFTGDDARQLRVEVQEGRDGVVICVIYPGHRRDDDDDECDSGTDFQGDDRDVDAGVNFTVRVPEGVKLAAYTVAGNVVATSLRSDVDAATVSGDVRVSTTGSASATSVSGNVDATFGQTREDMDFTTVSGDVVVRMPGDVGARVEAQTLSGQIDSDFPLDMGSMTGDDDDDDDDRGGVHVNVRIGRRATGTIGRGGPELTVTTVSGNIRLARGR
jgi:Putative adhesin